MYYLYTVHIRGALSHGGGGSSGSIYAQSVCAERNLLRDVLVVDGRGWGCLETTRRTTTLNGMHRKAT